MTPKASIFKDRSKFRVRIYDASGSTRSFIFNTKEEAELQIPALLAKAPVGKPVIEAVTLYGKHLELKDNKPASIAVTLSRLETVFGQTNVLTGDLTKESLLKLWKAYSSKGYAVDTQANTLGQTKSFLNWCDENGWLTDSCPGMGLKVLGRRRRGKPQLAGVDESRAFLDKALDLAACGDTGAVAAAIALVMGMRASEIAALVVRELDANGSVLIISQAKTEAGVRRLKIPEMLRPLLKRLTVGKGRFDKIFGEVDRHWVLRSVVRTCRLAGVSVVSAHGLRGTHASLAVEAGVSGDAVAFALGHEDFGVTKNHYAKSEAVAGAVSSRVGMVLGR